jgi:aminoglycoside phosphotransferase (APT) family kinase protein
MDDPSLAARLGRFLATQLPEAAAVRVTSLDRSTEGFSQETFTFDVECERGGRVERSAWVAKREPVAGLLEPYDLEPEFRVLHALSDDPLPSPPTPWFTRDPAVLDRPFYVMARLPGDVPIPAAGPTGTGPFAESDRAPLADDLVAALARLHAIDWRARGLGFLGDPGPGTGAARRELERWRARIVASGLPMDPPLAEALAWLSGHVPACDEVTLVHGDFRLGNFLVARDGATPRLSGILDWELVHLGDPLEDLAWCASPMWRAGTPLAAGLVEPDVLAARYAASTGRQVDPARLAFYDVLAIVKMMAIMMTGLRAYRDGRTTDPRMAIFDHQLSYLHLLLGMARGWLA